MNKKINLYDVGLVYIGSSIPFQSVNVVATSRTEACNIAANILKPNPLQTLTIISENFIGNFVLY
jgi:hypothetical protein